MGRALSVWLPTHDGGLICRATDGDASYGSLQGRSVAGGDRRAVLGAQRAVRPGRPRRSRSSLARSTRATLLRPTPCRFIPIDHGLAALACRDRVGRRRPGARACSRESRARPGSRSRTRGASRPSSGRSSRRSRRSQTRSRRRTSTRRRTPAGSRDMAIEVGRELGPRRRAARSALELGALFHDIGKIGDPVLDPHEARAADRPRSADHRAPTRSWASGSSLRSISSPRSARSCAPATSATTGRVSRPADGATRSRSSPESSSPWTRSMR